MRVTFVGRVVFLVAAAMAASSAAHATTYYFSDCGCQAAADCQGAYCSIHPLAQGCAGSPAQGSRENPWCLDPARSGLKNSFDYVMDGAAPDVVAGDTIALCAGVCDGSGTATYYLEAHDGWRKEGETRRVVFDPEASGTSSAPIVIQPYCAGSQCETVVLSGDSNGNNVYDAGEPVRMVNNVDDDSGPVTYMGQNWYLWRGNPDGDQTRNLIIEKVTESAFDMVRGGSDWTLDGVEVRYIGAPFYATPLAGTGGIADVGCQQGYFSSFGVHLERHVGRFTVRNSSMHHICHVAFRPLNNCNGQADPCTTGQGEMLIENNEFYNLEGVVNGHQGRNWTIRNNRIRDVFAAISIEEQVYNVLIEGNDISCPGQYRLDPGNHCRIAIAVNDGDGPPSDGCGDDCSAYGSGCMGPCTTRDVRIRRNHIHGASYAGEAGASGTYLRGAIAFFAHNSAGDLGNTIIENNMIWFVQQQWTCRTDQFYGTAPGSIVATPIGVYSSDPVTVQGNTVYDSSCWGILIGGGANHVVQNNLVVQSRQLANGSDLPELVVMTNSLGSTIRNNNFHGGNGGTTIARVCDTNNVCTTSHTCAQIAAGSLGTANRCAATLFRDVAGPRASWDLHLSPNDTNNRDRGTPVPPCPATDIDGQARVAACDLGADEMDAQDTTPPAPPRGVGVQP